MLLTRDELCEALGVSDSAISAWEKKGMPVVRKGRGQGMKSVYNFDRVKAWCESTGHGVKMAALIARSSIPATVTTLANSPRSIAAALFRAAHVWLDDSWTTGFNDQAGFDAATLSDLAESFLSKCADAFGADVLDLVSRALNSARARPDTIHAAIASIDTAALTLKGLSNGRA